MAEDMQNNSIQIYVQAHKPVHVPDHPLLLGLQIGAASNPPIEGMLQDNVGDNISGQNSHYCELTGQYWVWKNVVRLPDGAINNHAPAYVGFYHYRRYLRFTGQSHPYEILSYPDDATLQKMGYDPSKMEAFITNCDIVVPEPENLYETAWDNYRRAPHHFAEDLLTVSRIVVAMHPDYAQAVADYLGGTKFYLKNMYIMKRELFDAYCSWLFPILKAFDAQNNWEKYKGNLAANRVDGYLAERLFGIWFTKQKQVGSVRYGELPRVHFADMDGGKGSLKKMQLVNTVLPSGTRRRSYVSRMARFVLKVKSKREYR